MKRINIAPLLYTAALLMLAIPLFGQGWNVEMVSTLYHDWYSAEAVAVSGNYAFVAIEYSGIAVMDISDPENPFEVTCIYDVIASDVLIVGDYLYAASGGIKVIDISDPVNPIEVGSCLSQNTKRLAVQDDFAYVTTDDSGMSIIDISDPENPFEVGSIVSREIASDVAVQDNYAYLVSYIFMEPEDGYLQIIDISDPANPFETDYLFSSTQIYGVAVQDSFVYLAASNGGLKVVDVSDPYNPVYVETCTLQGPVKELTIYDNLVYAISTSFGVSIVDISDPLNLEEIGFCELGSCKNICIERNNCYVAAWNNGFKVLDVADPTNPFEIGYYDTEGKPCDIDLVGDTAFIAAKWGGGLRIVDVSDPYNPFEISRLDIEDSNCYGIAVSGDIVCLAEFSGGWLRIIDISDINNPVEVSILELEGIASQVEVEGEFAYVANSSRGLRIVDISDCVNPVVTSTFADYSCNDVKIANGYAYITTGNGGEMIVIDISDPANPTFVSSIFITLGSLEAIDVSGDHAYLANTYGGLEIVDISDPFNPVHVGEYYTISRSENIAAYNDFVFLVLRYSGLWVFDVSDPANPELVGSYNTPGWGEDVAISGNFAYFCDLYFFEIFDYSEAAGIVSQVTVSITPYNPPIQIPANGGVFEFNIALENTGTAPVLVDIWTMATLPDGSEYGPIINVSDFNLQPGANLNRDRDQNIPANAPAGVYTYDAYIGEYPDSIFAEDHFDFVKLIAADGGDVVKEWYCWGEDFDSSIDESIIINSQFSILNCFPNPFNASTVISFELRDAGLVSLDIFDVTGRSVGANGRSPLPHQWMPAGQHSITFDAKDLSSGVYFARLTAGEFSQVRKILLVK